MTSMLSTLPPLPTRMQRLPVDARGYPVPWFVTWLDESGTPVPNGQGTPDFRVITPQRIVDAVRFSRCWICGGTMGRHASFVTGPMCGVNRTNGEPPSHLDCANFAAQACPFLVRPTMRRRENDLPEGSRDAAGVMIRRNPGVCLVWTTKHWRPFKVENGILFQMGDPTTVTFWCEGRPATRDEVMHSVETGLPLLGAEADKDGSTWMLEKFVDRFRTLLPQA